MTQEPPAPPEAPSDRYGIILAALGGILVALLAAVIIIVLNRGEDGATATTTIASATSAETTLADDTTTLPPTTEEITTTVAATTTTAAPITTTLPPFSGDTSEESGPTQGTPTGRVIDIRHHQHEGYTRVVFDFSPGGIPGYYISYTGPTTLSVLLISVPFDPYEPGVFDASGEHAIGTISVGSVFSGGMGGGSGEWEFPIETTGTKAFSVDDPPRLYIDIAD